MLNERQLNHICAFLSSPSFEKMKIKTKFKSVAGADDVSIILFA